MFLLNNFKNSDKKGFYVGMKFALLICNRIEGVK